MISRKKADMCAMGQETLKQQTARGLFWGGMNNGVQQLLGLVFGIVLGRLLSPSDYGMTAMIAIFSIIANELQSSGFKTGLINLKAPRHEDYNAVFWFNVLAALAIYVVLWLSAPLIAAYFHQPQLVALCRYVFLGFVFSSVGMAQSAWLTKNMHIRQIAQAGMTATLVSSITCVVMAWQGFGYWALATQNILYILVNTALLWCHSSWRPTFAAPSVLFVPLRTMLPFSLRVMLSTILTQVNQNVMNILLGRYYGERQTGFYNQANQWSYKCSSVIQSMVRQVDQTVLVGLDDERERQLRVLRKMVRFTAFLSFPLLLGLALVSHEFIVLAIGEKWAFSASLLPLLCVSGAFLPLSALLTDAVISHKRSDVFLWNTLILGLLQIVLLIVLYPYGIRRMVEAYVVLQVVWVFVWHWFVCRLMAYRLIDFLKDVLPFALAASGVMAVTGWLTVGIGSLWLLLFSRFVLAGLLYLLVMKVAGAKILDECLRFIFRRGTS